MTPFLLEIITPQRKAFAEQVTSVTVPTIDGVITVLAHHISLFTALKEGEIKIVMGEDEYYLAIGGGFMEVTRDGVSILVSRALHAHELNAAEIEKAKVAAAEALEIQAKGVERAAAQSLLRRSVIELQVAGRLRTRQRTPYTPSSS